MIAVLTSDTTLAIWSALRNHVRGGWNNVRLSIFLTPHCSTERTWRRSSMLWMSSVGHRRCRSSPPHLPVHFNYKPRVRFSKSDNELFVDTPFYSNRLVFAAHIHIRFKPLINESLLAVGTRVGSVHFGGALTLRKKGIQWNSF